MQRFLAPRRAALTILTATIIFGAFAPSPAYATSQIEPGKTCTSEGMQARRKFAKKDTDKLYTCRMVNGKLRYSKGAPVAKISTQLVVSQVWRGNQVTLSILNSDGVSCTDAAAQAEVECQYFYLGWSANFLDSDRTVSYSEDGIHTIISGLQIGDTGWFEVMYDNPDDSEIPFWVKRFRFTYE